MRRNCYPLPFSQLHNARVTAANWGEMWVQQRRTTEAYIKVRRRERGGSWSRRLPQGVAVTMRILLLLFSTFLFCHVATAKDWAKYKKELESRTEGFLSQRAQKRIVRAQQYMARSNYKKAFEILEKIAKKTNVSPYEKSRVLYALAYAYAQKEKYAQAKKAFEQILAIDVLPHRPILQSLFSLAQFLALDNKIAAAEERMQQWFALASEPHPPAYIFMANLMYQKKKIPQALEFVLKGISQSSQPQESWMAFAVSLLYIQKKYKEASTWLYRLIEKKVNKKTYWKQLTAALLSRDQGFHALAVLKLAMTLDLLNEEGEILNLANLYLANALPFEASQIMQHGLKQEKLEANRRNFEILSNTLIHAKEYQAALKPLGQAAKMSKDGKLYALKARILLEQGKYEPALNDFDKAIQKGLKSNQMGRVLLEKGITLIQINRLDQANKAIEKASTYKSVAANARNWQKYLQSL